MGWSPSFDGPSFSTAVSALGASRRCARLSSSCLRSLGVIFGASICGTLSIMSFLPARTRFR